MTEGQGQQHNERTESSLVELFVPNPEIKESLHPHAAERYYRWIMEACQELSQLTTDRVVNLDADISTYLNDDDKARVEEYAQNILDWLHKCTNIGKGDSPYPYDTFVSSDLAELKRLVRTAYERKEEHKQWQEAFHHVFPLKLAKDAERYLSKDEFDQLYKAACVAIEVYLQEGDSYLDRYKTFDFRLLLEKIDNEKEKERILNDAQVQEQAFRARLAKGLKAIEEMLSPQKEDPTVLFKRYCANNGESRYLGESFADMLTSDSGKKRNWTQGCIPAAEEELQKSIPGECRDFVLTKPTADFFLLPSATYEHPGLPCLGLYFEVFAVVTISVSAQAGQKVFNGHAFNLLTHLKEPELLGIYQIVITPQKPRFWQSIPVSIIRALLDGNLQPQGTTILERTEERTIYEVKKLEEEICEIPVSFERYCRSLGSAEKMKEVQIVRERTAEILESPEPIVISQRGSESKKAQAFELFRKGKRPRDSEVKNLGIKPESAYRYFQDWKKLIK